MGKIKSGFYGYTICFVTGLIIGILIGTIILTIIISYRMDEHYKNIISLEDMIQEKDAKLENLEKAINVQNITLQNIEINLILEKDDMDEMDKIDVGKAIKEKYSSLLGKEVKNIDSDILVEVIDKRIFKIENKEYRLYIERLILTETLQIYIRVEIRG